MDAEALARLHLESRIPPAELVGKLNKGFGDLDYMGHAAVTDVLLRSDPLWTWEPVAWDEAGRPLADRDKEGWARGLWIRLTVHDHTRLGYGSCPPGKPDAMKELIGDALRNAAMRFGVGLSLWAKEEWQDLDAVHKTPPSDQPTKKTAKKEPPAPADGGGPVLRGDQAIAALAAKLGLDEQTRVDILRACTGATSGKDLNAEQVTKVMRNLRWVADGFVSLEYDPRGVPSLVDSKPGNPGPASPEQRVDG